MKRLQRQLSHSTFKTDKDGAVLFSIQRQACLRHAGSMATVVANLQHQCRFGSQVVQHTLLKFLFKCRPIPELLDEELL